MITIDINFVEDDWQETKHPRGQPGNAGEFAPGGGGKAAPRPRSKPTAPVKASPQAKASPRAGMVPLEDKTKVPDHIAKVRLPPAWKDVHYHPDPNAALYAVGKDAKGRAQYVYNPKFAASQAEAKFNRIAELHHKFEEIHQENHANKKSPDEIKSEHAHLLHLIMQTGIRPGSDTDTKADKQAYGATTLQGKHVVTDKAGKVNLKFTGKKGVSLNIPVEDQEAAQTLSKAAAKSGPGGQLFPNVTDKSLLDYVHSLDGGNFKTKDMRTLVGTRTAMGVVDKMSAPTNEKEYKKAVKEVATKVSEKLGNTPTIALQAYINPTVFAGWRANAGIS